MSEKIQSATRKEQAVLTRRRILDTARKLFSENGYKGTSVRSINRAAGVAESLMYHYFPGGKKELFGVIAAESFYRIIQEMRTLHGDYQCDNIPLEELMENGFLNFARVVDSNLDVIRIILREKEVREIFNENEMNLFSEKVDAYFEKLLTRRIENGEIRSINCKDAAFCIKSLLLNYIIIVGTELACSETVSAEGYAALIKRQAAFWKA